MEFTSVKAASKVVPSVNGLRPVEAALSPKFGRAMALLLEASIYAQRSNCSRWEFAVGARHLLRLGLSENDLRFLVRMRYLDQAREVVIAGCEWRQFRPMRHLSITKRTCFVLTSQGMEAALIISGEKPDAAPECRATEHRLSIAGFERADLLPSWQADRRILTFGGRLVKRFKWRAVNQELVLLAFQEEDWPTRILDPLTPHPSLDVKRRLSDTIKCLNRGHENPMIHFRGDGTGQGVVWESLI